MVRPCKTPLADSPTRSRPNTASYSRPPFPLCCADRIRNSSAEALSINGESSPHPAAPALHFQAVASPCFAQCAQFNGVDLLHWHRLVRLPMIRTRCDYGNGCCARLSFRRLAAPLGDVVQASGVLEAWNMLPGAGKDVAVVEHMGPVLLLDHGIAERRDPSWVVFPLALTLGCIPFHGIAHRQSFFLKLSHGQSIRLRQYPKKGFCVQPIDVLGFCRRVSPLHWRTAVRSSWRC